MSKPFGLVLALAAAGAHAEAGGESGLVVSALFGTEPPSYVHAAVANVLGFTLPTTKIVVSYIASRAWIPSISRSRMTRRTC